MFQETRIRGVKASVQLYKTEAGELVVAIQDEMLTKEQRNHGFVFDAERESENLATMALSYVAKTLYFEIMAQFGKENIRTTG